MEKISIFDYIEQACNVLDLNIAGFSRAADKLTEYLQSTFGGIDATVGVTSRIKTRDSLKEKILRNGLYKNCGADRLVYEMHDIIGVRIECRFFKDEEYLYNKIRETFCVDAGGGYFSPQGKKAVKLKLDTPQPEKQKNGFDIYRIDGSVVYSSETYNFELQIKSLVNSFWSEIEHKLIYKNVLLGQLDNLMKDMLNSIHESLTGVDHQLSLIFDRFSSNTIEAQQVQLERMLSLGLNDVYTAIVKAKTGITISISDYSEAVVSYLLSCSSYMKEAHGVPLRKIIGTGLGVLPETDDDGSGDFNYGSVLISLMEWLRTVDYSSIAIGNKIELDVPALPPIESAVADVFLNNINSDFYLNTFFHIFFSLERGTDDEDFLDYIGYYTERITRGKTQERIYRTLAALGETDANKLPLEKTIAALAEL